MRGRVDSRSQVIQQRDDCSNRKRIARRNNGAGIQGMLRDRAHKCVRGRTACSAAARKKGTRHYISTYLLFISYYFSHSIRPSGYLLHVCTHTTVSSSPSYHPLIAPQQFIALFITHARCIEPRETTALS